MELGFPAPASMVLPGQATVATLYSLFDPTLNARRYAWVSDLFGGLGDYVISDGQYWRPVRPLALQSAAATDMTITTLANAPTLIVTGSIGTAVTRTVTISPTNAYPGAKFRVVRQATGLGALIAGIVSLPINGWSDLEWNGSAWVQTASGGLL